MLGMSVACWQCQGRDTIIRWAPNPGPVAWSSGSVGVKRRSVAVIGPRYLPLGSRYCDTDIAGTAPLPAAKPGRAPAA
jgi:hypothetical protein